MLALALLSISIDTAQGINTLGSVVIAAIITIVNISKYLNALSEIRSSTMGFKMYQTIWLKKKSLRNFQVTYSIILLTQVCLNEVWH